MPFELHVSPDGSLARVRGWGAEDFASTLEGIQRIGNDPRLTPGMPIVIDARELDYLATPPEVAVLADPGSFPAFFTGRRVAILARRGAQFGVSRVFAAKSEHAGAVIHVFAEEQEALAWAAGLR